MTNKPNDELTEALLAKPVGPAMPPRRVDPAKDFTHEIVVRIDGVELTVRDKAGLINEGTGLLYLEEEGLNPDEWEATHFRKIKYGQGMESVKFSYKRKSLLDDERPPLDELFAEIKKHRPKANRPTGSYGAIIALGDMQFGKIDGDGVEGTLNRTIEYLNKAADEITSLRGQRDIGHIHVAFLGDHIEGFTSQGGANVWRTVLTTNEQIRLVRRVMLHALTLFAPMADTMTMAAVPGNHGEPQRFAGKGTTRYDDSHDTESLIAVMDAARLNDAAFGHVKFFVPETDEMTVVLDVAGTVVAHVHGHQWRKNKHFDWWKGQAFHADGQHAADLLLAGHLHHLLIEDDGPRRFVQVPALESESTWFRHSSGTGGNPGIVLAITSDHKTNLIGMIQ